MALSGKKGCIARAGKALDVDDKQYLEDQLRKGKSDTQALNALERRLQRDRKQLVKAIKSEGGKVETVSEESSSAPSSDAAPSEGRAKKGEAEEVSEESDSTVGTDQELGSPLRVNRSKPSPKAEGNDANSGSPLLLEGNTADAAIAKLREASPMFDRFMKLFPDQLFIAAKTNSYFADTDTVQLQKSKLDLNKQKDLDKMVTMVEHEITHANTVGFVHKTLKDGSNQQALQDIRYLHKAIDTLETLDFNGIDGEIASRIFHIVRQPSEEMQIAEFLAVMNAESDVSNAIYAALGRKQGLSKKTLSETLRRLAKRVAQYFTDITKADLEADVDIEILNDAIMRTVDRGTEFREQRYDEFRSYTQRLGAFNWKGSPIIKEGLNQQVKEGAIPYTRKASFDYANYAVSSMITSRLERRGKTVLGNLHDVLDEKFPLYHDAAKKLAGIYDGSPALQQFIHTVTGENVDKMKKADVLAKYAAINAQRTEIINDQMRQINQFSQNLSDKEKETLNQFINDVNLHDYFVHTPKLRTAKGIEARAELLRKKLWKTNPQHVRQVEHIINWNLNGEQTGNVYNLDTLNIPRTGDYGVDMRSYMALESIRQIGAKKFEKLLKNNKDLMDVIKDNSVANVMSSIGNEGTQTIRDSLVMDYWKEPFQIKSVTQADFKMFEFGEETGWKVLQAPGRNELGIVYKPEIDATSIGGAYTDTKLSTTDVNVDQRYKKFKNVVESPHGHKLLLTKQQKKDLGLIEELGQGLVRSAAHSIAIKESQIIRDALLKEDTWMEVGGARSNKKLEKIIESDNIDNPWFLKLDEGKSYNELPASVKAKYMPVGNRASNVKSFNMEVDLVRKDISHWLLGGSSKSLFENPQLKWAMRILKNLVSGAKIGMVVLNPLKIANDNMSNLAYLGVLGLDPIFIAKNYKEISTDFAEYSDLQRQIFQLKVQSVARPNSTKIKSQIKKLQKRLAANSIGDIADKGFVNSLGSDLVSRNADTLSGFQADMHKALEYLLTDSAGNKNVVSHFIMQMQKIGFQAEDFFSYVGGIAGKSKSTKLMQQELDQVADRLHEIKSEDDIINYVAQFTTSPSSEAVRLGSAMTDLTDVMAKETLYRYFVEQKGMKPENAKIEVLDSFPDYKENMPLSVQQLSDVGIIMFPSFWLRIQKIIYRMLRDRPVNLATELMIQDALGTNVNTIFEANVINKSETFGGLIHPPYEPVGFGSVVPMHVFG